MQRVVNDSVAGFEFPYFEVFECDISEVIADQYSIITGECF